VTEGLNLASSAKVVVAENAATGTAFDKGFNAPTTQADKVKSVAVSATNGQITVTYGTKIEADKTVIMEPKSGTAALVSGTPPASQITWTCTGGNLAAKYRPSECRS
jgi:type IV pilus assembly protein PilA